MISVQLLHLCAACHVYISYSVACAFAWLCRAECEVNGLLHISGQVWYRVLAPMGGLPGSEDVAEGAVDILKQALQVRAGQATWKGENRI